MAEVTSAEDNQVAGLLSGAEATGHASTRTAAPKVSNKKPRLCSAQGATENPDPLQVMIIDDDNAVLKSAKRLFESLGCRVASAGRSVDAMADLSVKHYDLVVTDFDMPGMNGLRLCTWLKVESPATRVIIMTGRCPAEIPPFMSAGLVDRWIFKPFGRQDVCEVLERMGLPHS